MAQYTDNNGIKYNNVIKGAPMPKITNQSNDYNDLDAGVAYTVNAIEIDWNGAGIANTTVNTTGELLKIINDLYGKVKNIDEHLVTTATILYGDGVSGVGGKSEYVTPEIIKNASKLTDISVNLAAINNYSYSDFVCRDQSKSLIIRLPYSENNTPANIYPSIVQFEAHSSGRTYWEDIGFLNSTKRNDNQIRTYTTSNYSYFVITSYTPETSRNIFNYRLNFTKNKPNYEHIGVPETTTPPTT